MEAFQLLSRGGATFDKRRFKSDVRLFVVSPNLPSLTFSATSELTTYIDATRHPWTDPQKEKKADVDTQQKGAAPQELPPELDFFRYAQAGDADGRKPKRKAVHASEDERSQKEKKKKKRHGDHADTETDAVRSNEASSTAPQPPRHRVTAKGSNVPEPIDSFSALKDRYQIPSHLLSNLTQYGFVHPTGIQSHGIPILLEVRVVVCLVSRYSITAGQDRDLAAISPTGTGKTLSYLLPVMSALGAPASSAKSAAAAGVRALIVAPTRELAHQIHNECLKLAQGRKWRIVLFSKATASTLGDKATRNRVGECGSVYGYRAGLLITADVIIATPLRLVASLQNGSLELDKYVESNLTQGLDCPTFLCFPVSVI